MDYLSYDPKTPKRKRSKYPIVIIALLLVNTIIIALALHWLYNTLLAYEAGTPSTAIHRYFARLAEEDYEVIDAESGFVPDGVNGWAEYNAYLQQLYRDVPQDLRFRKVAAQRDDGAHTYAIYAGDDKVAEVLLYEGQAAGGGWLVRAPVAYGQSYTVTAPGHVTVLMNGAPLPTEGAERVDNDAYAGLPDPALIPYRLTYQVQPALHLPEFTATDVWGNASPLIENGTRLEATVALTAEAQAEYAARIEEVAKAQSRYNTNDLELDAFATMFYPGTPYYGLMRSYTDRQWVLDHNPTTFRDINVYDIVSLSENCFTGKIDFTTEVVLLESTRVQEFPASYQMFFVRHEGSWLLWDIHMV